MHRRLSFAAVLALPLALLLGCGAAPEKPPPIPEIALDGFTGTVRERLDASLETLRATPDDPQANGQAAMLLHAYSRLEAAETLYRRAHALDPDALRWIYYLGVAQAEQGDHEAAARSFESAIEANPSFSPARQAQAAALLEMGRLDQAIETYQQLVKDRPGDARALYGLGRARTRANDATGAVDALSRAVALAPRYGAAHYQLALAQRDQGDAEASARHLAVYERDRLTVPLADDSLMAAVHALRSDPAERLRRARTLEREGRIDGAVQELLLAVEADPTLVQGHINLMILYGRTGRADLAEQAYRKALELNADRAELHYNYGVLMVTVRKLDEAEKAFERALESNPRHAASLHNLGQMKEGRRSIAEARTLYRRAIEARPDYRLAHFHLGRLLLNEGDSAEAIREMLRSLEPEDQQTPEFLYGLVEAYSRSGDRAQALRYGERAKTLASRYKQTELLQAIEKDLARLRR